MLVTVYDSNISQLNQLTTYISHWMQINKKSISLRTYTDYHALNASLAYYGEGDLVFFNLDESQKAIHQDLLLLRKICPQAEIVITSSNILHAELGYPIHATWFLLKPYNPFSVGESLHKCCDNYKNKKSNSLRFSFHQESYSVEYSDIEYFESNKHYISIVAQQKTFFFRENIGCLCTYLPSSMFLRCHKSYIVNITYIKSIGKDTLTLTSGASIPLSRYYKSSIEQAFLLYSSGSVL